MDDILNRTKLDFMGMPIQPDAMVVYPVRRGSNMELHKMIVKRIHDDGRLIGYRQPDGRRVNIERTDRVVVVPHNESIDEDMFDDDDEWGL